MNDMIINLQLDPQKIINLSIQKIMPKIINRPSTISHLLFLLLLMLTLLLAPVRTNDDDPGQQDLIDSVPGYGAGAPRVFAGYVRSRNNVSLHYVLLESKNGKTNNDPLTFWISGEPGCTSKLGFLMEIGPFLLPPGVPYNTTVTLTPNPYSWNGLSNILFIDAPPGVGYSLNGDIPYIYNDPNMAEDNLNGLLSFLADKFPSFKSKSLYLAGQGYAGKFIPDLALRINAYNLNAETKIGLKGILVGNGIMDLVDNGLEKSQIDFMFSHNFVDPTLDKYWEIACQSDVASAGCAFFLRRYDDLLAKTNFHDIYGTCYEEPASQILKDRRLPTLAGYQNKKMQYYNLIRKCQYLKGFQNYFQININQFRGRNEKITPCNETIYNLYQKNQAGSMNEYARLISQTTVRIHLFSGDWDDIVPFTDTIKNIERLGMRQNGELRYWTNGKNQHVGFKRTYTRGQREIKYWIVKGAGHEVPQQRPEVAYQLFKGFLNNYE